MCAAAPANNTRKKQGGKRGAGAGGGPGWGHWDGAGAAQRPPCCSRHSCVRGAGTVCTQSPLPLGLPPDGPEKRGAEGGEAPRYSDAGEGTLLSPPRVPSPLSCRYAATAPTLSWECHQDAWQSLSGCPAIAVGIAQCHPAPARRGFWWSTGWGKRENGHFSSPPRRLGGSMFPWEKVAIVEMGSGSGVWEEKCFTSCFAMYLALVVTLK